MTDDSGRRARADAAGRPELRQHNAPLVRVALVAGVAGLVVLGLSLLVDPWLQLVVRVAVVIVLGAVAVRTYRGLARNSRQVRSGRR